MSAFSSSGAAGVVAAPGPWMAAENARLRARCRELESIVDAGDGAEVEVLKTENKRLRREVQFVIGTRDLAALQRDQAEKQRDVLTVALRRLYEETADYIRINNLGDVHHNVSMQMARDALAKIEAAP